MKHLVACIIILLVLLIALYIPIAPSNVEITTANLHNLYQSIIIHFVEVVLLILFIYFSLCSFKKKFEFQLIIAALLLSAALLPIALSKIIIYSHAVQFIKTYQDAWMGQAWGIQNDSVCGEKKQREYLFVNVSSDKIRVLCPFRNTFATIPYKTEIVSVYTQGQKHTTNAEHASH